MPTKENTSARYTVAKRVPAGRCQVERPAAPGDKPDREPSAAAMMLHITYTSHKVGIPGTCGACHGVP